MSSNRLRRSDLQLALPLQEQGPREDSRHADSLAREAALDITQSFIVRAPAGSGKTELLTQRVLALLASAEAPEEIVAMTFTRKAAAEMKDRLLQALTSAAAASSPPSESHRARTWQLARDVLVRDHQLGWELTSNPSRLRIQTIDALAQWLAQQIPITTRFAANAQVIEQAEALYASAASATLRLVDSSDPAHQAMRQHIARLLTHLDNDWMRAQRLLSAMLARRDQWLRYAGQLDRGALEAPMQRECARQLERVHQAFPEAELQELIALARYASANLPGDAPMALCASLDSVPAFTHRQLEVWRALASILLTKEGGWRAKLTKTEGFPAIAGGARFKQRAETLLDRLRANEPLRQALHGLRELPAPHFEPEQWQALESIVALLPRAAAELMVVFAEAGETDFVQLTRSAVEALGDHQSASDIAHVLDARIRHLLIDEFQDTSITQFELIERLIADWQRDDGRTLFVVGDPMQSIYRFREAEVGLFLRAWNDGIAGVRLRPLTLTRNYRSDAALIGWANAAFARVMPLASDIASGAVAFEASVAHQTAAAGRAVTFTPLIDGSPRDEATRVVEIVRRIRGTDARGTIALLVRARGHLAQIVPALRKANLPFVAVELELLMTRPLIGDLFALTRALEHLADRVAWLAVLRAPWCGLTLADLSALAEGTGDATIWHLMNDSSQIARLSSDGRQRLERIAGVLARAIELRGQGDIAQRARETWWLLGGPACVSGPADHADADSFFDHLARHEGERDGVIDFAAFEVSLARLHAAPDPRADDGLQVMTIHRAKGLEFDYVIVPGLSAATNRDDAQLMQWLERPTASGMAELLLSPVYPPTADKKEDSIYCWIEGLHQQRQAHEDARLLYVAATRARRELHWLACVATNNGALEPPREQSLLQRLWPAVEGECEAALADVAMQTRDALVRGFDQSLRRLPSDWTYPIAPTSIDWRAGETPPSAETAIEFSWAGQTARRIGVVVHRWLQRIGEDELNGWDAVRVGQVAPHIERELAATGITGDELKLARMRVERALLSALSDPRAQWLLGPHADARSELRLSIAGKGGVTRIVIDRTFTDRDGKRWIIDYKTGIHEGAETDVFLDREQQRYRQQLEGYATAFNEPSRLGLYFPLIPGWREWERDGDNGA